MEPTGVFMPDPRVVELQQTIRELLAEIERLRQVERALEFERQSGDALLKRAEQAEWWLEVVRLRLEKHAAQAEAGRLEMRPDRLIPDLHRLDLEARLREVVKALRDVRGSTWCHLYGEGLHEATGKIGETSDDVTGYRVHISVALADRLRALAVVQPEEEPWENRCPICGKAYVYPPKCRPGYCATQHEEKTGPTR